MFNAEYLHSKLEEQPFVPFRLITSSGQAYDITHPELLMVGKSRLVVGTASNDHPGIFETTNMVAILHVTDLQELLLPAKAGNNGSV